MGQPDLSYENHGFVGAVSGMALTDILQIKSANRFSGAITVENQGNHGTIFLKDGEVIHTEQAELSGESAFYEIIRWRGGTFKSEPKVFTTLRTIHKSMTFLLLEALSLLDDAGSFQKLEKNGSSKSSVEGKSKCDINTKLKTISGVEHAVIITKEGQVVDDTSCNGETLGGYGLYLALFAGQISSHFGIGAAKTVTVHAKEHHLFLFDSKKHHLCVSSDATASVGAYESEIRRVMAEK